MGAYLKKDQAFKPLREIGPLTGRGRLTRARGGKALSDEDGHRTRYRHFNTSLILKRLHIIDEGGHRVRYRHTKCSASAPHQHLL